MYIVYDCQGFVKGELPPSSRMDRAIRESTSLEREAYRANSVGCAFMNLQHTDKTDFDQKAPSRGSWIRERIENPRTKTEGVHTRINPPYLLIYLI